jgi:lysophospholipase L1-like esterase
VARIGGGVLAAAVVSVVPRASGDFNVPCGETHWVGSWSASPSNYGHMPLRNQTIRMIVTPHLGGRRVRIGFSNRFGDRPLVLRGVRIATVEHGAAVIESSDTRVTFDGRSRVRLRAGHDRLSDAVRFPLRAFREIAISAHVPRRIPRVTQHQTSSRISYLSEPGSGNKTSQADGHSLDAMTARWLLVNSVQVRAAATTGSVVALGDSITDGLYSGVNADARYPDHLQRRLRHSGVPLSVLNAGISGNMLTRSSEPSSPFGPSALARLRADVLAQAGVSNAVVLEGINDLRQLGPQKVIEGLREVVESLRSHGVNVVLGTLTPADSNLEQGRARVNRWIRARSDTAVADFDRVMRDTSDSARLASGYDSGDGLHPSPAGYEALARAVPIGALETPGCHGE